MGRLSGGPPRVSLISRLRQALSIGRDFWLLLTGEGISLLGNFFGGMAMVWILLERTGSATTISHGMLLGLLPPLLLGPVAGVLLDRFSRRRLMMAADLINALVTGFVTLTLWNGTFQVWHAFLQMFAHGVLRTIYDPSALALLPSLVSREQFQRANALQMTSRSIVGTAGMAVAGLAIRLFGETAALGFDAATFLLSAACIGAIRGGYRGLGAGRGYGLRQGWRDMGDGLRFMLRTPLVWHLILVANLMNFSSAPASVVLPVFTQKTLGGDVAGYGLMNSLASAGALFGATFVAARGSVGRSGRMVILSSLWIGLGKVLLALSPNVPAATAFMFAAAVPGPLMGIAYSAIYRDVVPEEVRGRVYAWRHVASTVATPLAVAAAGPLVDSVGPQAVMLGLGAVGLASGLLASASRPLRDV